MSATSHSRRRRSNTATSRRWKIVRWVTIAAGGVLVTLAIIAAIALYVVFIYNGLVKARQM